MKNSATPTRRDTITVSPSWKSAGRLYFLETPDGQIDPREMQRHLSAEGAGPRPVTTGLRGWKRLAAFVKSLALPRSGYSTTGSVSSEEVR